jgi:hypothetical protein
LIVPIQEEIGPVIEGIGVGLTVTLKIATLAATQPYIFE